MSVAFAPNSPGSGSSRGSAPRHDSRPPEVSVCDARTLCVTPDLRAGFVPPGRLGRLAMWGCTTTRQLSSAESVPVVCTLNNFGPTRSTAASPLYLTTLYAHSPSSCFGNHVIVSLTRLPQSVLFCNTSEHSPSTSTYTIIHCYCFPHDFTRTLCLPLDRGVAESITANTKKGTHTEIMHRETPLQQNVIVRFGK